jgi:hypothetical protein
MYLKTANGLRGRAAVRAAKSHICRAPHTLLVNRKKEDPFFPSAAMTRIQDFIFQMKIQSDPLTT